MSLAFPERMENQRATPLPISVAMKPTPPDRPRSERIWPPIRKIRAAAVLSIMQTTTSLKTFVGPTACVFMVFEMPDVRDTA
jgi:hypothetical protein